jgi:type IV fimbrial biogenesis protein FimT
LKQPSGFTLTEVLVVITIVAILAAIGAPSFRSVTNSNRIAGEVNGLLGDMQFARGEAIKEGQDVTVCASADGKQCNGAGATNWEAGWIVFSNPDGDAQVDAAAGETIWRVQTPFTATDTFTPDAAIGAVTFNREGFALGLPNTVTVKLHDSTSNAVWTRCLAISIVGQLATQTTRTPAPATCT